MLYIVIPCYNEQEVVTNSCHRLHALVSTLPLPVTLLFVDDGSRDATMFQLKKLFRAQKCPVKVVSFSRNFGKEAAIYAGLKQTSGQYVTLIDADLQQRPEIVRDMVKILDEQEEYDVVAAYQDHPFIMLWLLIIHS